MSDTAPVKRVLFVCVENSNRSQMAEAFARMHGAGKIEAFTPAPSLPGGSTLRAIEFMREVGYDLTGHHSKAITDLPPGEFAAVIGMGCGDACPLVPAERREEWAIPDPKELPPEHYREVRDD